MFGNIRKQREKKRMDRRIAFSRKKENPNKPSNPKKAAKLTSAQKDQKASNTEQSQIDARVAQSKADRESGRVAGEERGKKFLSQDFQGLPLERKKEMQYEGHRQAHRATQSANRQLLGDQNQMGIVGRGGVGYAQQADLMRKGQEAKNQVTRDVNKIDEDRRLKNMAAQFTIEEGEAANAGLDRQQAIDEIRLADERKKQKYYEDQANKLFSRV